MRLVQDEWIKTGSETYVEMCFALNEKNRVRLPAEPLGESLIKHFMAYSTSGEVITLSK